MTPTRCGFDKSNPYVLSHGSISKSFLNFAMNHVRFMIGPELYVVQETLSSGILFLTFLLQFPHGDHGKEF
jgi:hypothetical protein